MIQKHHCNVCMEEWFKILKKIRDRKVKPMKKSWRYTGHAGTKQPSIHFS